MLKGYEWSHASATRQGDDDPPTEAMTCPSCNGETTRREWSIGTMIFVDVCIECRGVWLDGGESSKRHRARGRARSDT